MESDGTSLQHQARPLSPPPPPPPSHRFADAAAAVLRRLSLRDAATGADADGGGTAHQPSLTDRAQAAINGRRNAVAALLDRVMAAAADHAPSSSSFSPILMPHVLRDALQEECGGGGDAEAAPPPSDGLDELLGMVTEAVARPPTLALALRPGVGLAAFLALDGHSLRVSRLTVNEYLAVKEAVAGVRLSLVEQVLGCVELDMAPFWPRGLPSCGRPANIGQGVSFINRSLCARLMRAGSEDGPSAGAAALHAYLSALSLGGQPLGLNAARLRSPASLPPAVARAIAWLETVPDDTPWPAIAPRLADLGFAPGWGCTAGRARESLTLLDDALAAPHPAHLEALLARLPGAGHAVVMVSPHGFFAQSGALGKPDTGGQVVYVLDAVRALEKELADRAAAAGIAHLAPPRIIILTRLIVDAGETSCNLRREAVEGTNHAVILRVPFRNGGGVLRPWVSRFKVWPYLEQFAVDAASEIVAELGGLSPSLIVGHYSDGGLVASLLAREFGPGTTMAFVAHALEKTKYPQSALRWASPELRDYNFGCHFTADLININVADFIITSTYQEIAGSTRCSSGGGGGASSSSSSAMAASPGQYESMAAFAMPGLFRAVNAVDVFDPRYNIVSPGADADIYFPFSEAPRRLTSLQPSLKALIYGPADPEAKASRGSLDDDGSPILFSMARLDKVKNLAGLAAWYADSPRLQAACQLFIVGGQVDASAGGGADPEADGEAAALHALFDAGRLPAGRARWVPQQTNPVRNGELYRLVADGRGAFVLPSLFENFGLTVIEAAASGLPAFVTCHGGPAEIVHDGVEGLHIDPYHGSAAADKMAGFFEAAAADGGATWERTSKAALARVAARYNWRTYADRLTTMSRVYAFWRTATRLDQASAARTRYLELVYQLILRPLMARVRAEGGGGGGEEEGTGQGDGEVPPSDSCRGVCAVALGALADPGRVAPPSGPPSPASGGGGGGGIARRSSSSGRRSGGGGEVEGNGGGRKGVAT